MKYADNPAAMILWVMMKAGADKDCLYLASGEYAIIKELINVFYPGLLQDLEQEDNSGWQE